MNYTQTQDADLIDRLSKMIVKELDEEYRVQLRAAEDVLQTVQGELDRFYSFKEVWNKPKKPRPLRHTLPFGSGAYFPQVAGYAPECRA